MKKLLLLASTIFMTGSLSSQSVTRLLAVSQGDDQLRVLDTNTYATLNVITTSFTNAALSVDGFTGLTKHPVTGALYVIAKEGSGDRYLGKLNAATGAVDDIGILGDNFATLTFNANNTLLGVTGNGASVPNTAYRINLNNASNTMIGAMVNGSYGESISFNPTINKIYHWTGSAITYEKYDTSFTAPINIPTAYSDEIGASVFKAGNKFITTTYFGDFSEADTSGNFTPIMSYSTGIKGLAYITCPRAITGTFTFCANSTTTLTMSSGGASYQWYVNGTAVANATNQAIITSTAGYYKCMITDGCGTDSIAAGVTTQSVSLPTVSISGPSVVCAGQTVTLTGSSGGSSQWYMNGVLQPGATANTFTVNAAGIYNMTKTNTNGCKDSAAVGHQVSVSPCTGINENSLNASIRISPNPTTGKFIIESGEDIVSYFVTDITGKKVIREQKNNSSIVNVNISELDNAIYFVTLTGASGKTQQLKIILSK
jgi:hypothetical protein